MLLPNITLNEITDNIACKSYKTKKENIEKDLAKAVWPEYFGVLYE
jgi:hypothetical protein